MLVSGNATILRVLPTWSTNKRETDPSSGQKSSKYSFLRLPIFGAHRSILTLPMSSTEKDSAGCPPVLEIEYAANAPDLAGKQPENLVYLEDEEPELHISTCFALAAMFLLNLVQVFGLMGPPAAVGLHIQFKVHLDKVYGLKRRFLNSFHSLKPI